MTTTDAQKQGREAAAYALRVVAEQNQGRPPSVDQTADALAGILPPDLRDALLFDACVRLVKAEMTRRDR